MNLFNPLISGFNPDPSVVAVDDVYYLVTSTFEYLPAIPVYRSTDLENWQHIGNVATRPEQVMVGRVTTGMGVWAPTIRHRAGLFYVIVTVAGSPRGCVLFTAVNPTGPWSDGITIDGVDGIDPDLAWDDAGTAYVTFSGLTLSGPAAGTHQGIQQVRVDLEAGTALERPRLLWSGTGLKFPEAPHLYRRGEDWYLMIAEGGTERGHSVSVARGPTAEGPFTGHPHNPFLSAKGTDSPIQNTGHADLVSTPHGDLLVLLGMRPLAGTQSFSPLGRETFVTTVSWVDGWPYAPLPTLTPRAATDEIFDFATLTTLDDPGWLAVRRAPTAVAALESGRLVMQGTVGLTDPRVSFLGRRQRHLSTVTSVTIDASRGAGGLASRYDEQHWFAVEVRGTTVTATAHLSGLEQRWQTEVAAGEVELRIDTAPTDNRGIGPSGETGGDRIRLSAGGTLLTELDGRYWTAETCASFAGRVVGMYASQGAVYFGRLRYQGHE